MGSGSITGFGAAAALTAAMLVGAPTAIADEPDVVSIGDRGELVNGDIVQAWTVESLKPSDDAIPYTPRGRLWEAIATDEAVRGSVTPIVSNFNARSAAGDSYRVLFGVATAEGVNPRNLAAGEKTTGKLYFDVTGEDPIVVVYSTPGDDLLVWTRPIELRPETASGGSAGSAGRSGSATGSSTTPPGAAAEATEVEDGEGAVADEDASATTADGSQPASQGTPVVDDGEEPVAPPLAGQTDGTAGPVSSGTPVAEGTPAVEGTPVAVEGPATAAVAPPASDVPLIGQPHGPQAATPAAAPASQGTAVN